MKTRKFLSSVLALVMMCSVLTLLPTTAAAASLQMNVSSQPCYANLSKAPLPQYQVPSQGDTYYLNLAGTSDLKLDRAEFYIKAPNQSSYTRIYSYDPSGYFRWVNCSYKFTQSGTYTFRIYLTTTSGGQASGEISFYVNAKSSAVSYGSTYTHNGNTFDVVPNFSSKYCYNQNDYSRFVNSSGKNRGCTAVAMCIAYSIYNNTELSPDSVKWSSAGTSWEYCTRYKDSSKTYKASAYTQKEALKAAYNSVVYDGIPMVIGVYGAGCDHVVTIVGVKQTAKTGSLSLGDFLIVDPWGGSVTTLDKYTSIDCGWSLRIPLD